MILKKLVEQKPITLKDIENRLRENEEEENAFKASIERMFEKPIHRILEVLERRKSKPNAP